MTPEEIRARLQADAQQRGIDLSGLPLPGGSIIEGELLPPSGSTMDLVSFMDSIADGIQASSDADILAMIQRILSIKQTTTQEEVL